MYQLSDDTKHFYFSFLTAHKKIHLFERKIHSVASSGGHWMNFPNCMHERE